LARNAPKSRLFPSGLKLHYWKSDSEGIVLQLRHAARLAGPQAIQHADVLVTHALLVPRGTQALVPVLPALRLVGDIGRLLLVLPDLAAAAASLLRHDDFLLLLQKRSL